MLINRTVSAAVARAHPPDPARVVVHQSVLIITCADLHRGTI
jgi:hypothetical protein